MDPISAVAEAVGTLRLGDLLMGALHPDQASRITHEQKLAQQDMQDFCTAVELGHADTCNLLLGGLRGCGPLPELTAADIGQLQAIQPVIDGATLARLYILARGGDLAARIGEIVRETPAKAGG